MEAAETPGEDGIHTMVRSVHGPEFCCQECSTARKAYVEWPCPSVFLRTCLLLGSVVQGG